MTFTESLTLYTASQKTVAYGFISCGAILLLAALVITVLSPAYAALWNGVRIGALVFGLMTLAGGVGYLSFTGKTHQQIVSDYETSAEDSLTTESARMDKVVRDFTVYQMVFSVVVLIALCAIVFAKPFWSGFAFPAAFLYVAILLIEAQSKYSIDQHTSQVHAIAAAQRDNES